MTEASFSTARSRIPSSYLILFFIGFGYWLPAVSSYVDGFADMCPPFYFFSLFLSCISFISSIFIVFLGTTNPLLLTTHIDLHVISTYVVVCVIV